MISKIEALNYRCLKYVSQPLERFQVLVGPNASGKSSFLDGVALL
jgi:predicted ATPase